MFNKKEARKRRIKQFALNALVALAIAVMWLGVWVSLFALSN